MTDILLACPFCGAPPRKFKYPYSTAIRVRCAPCGIDRTLAGWNDRAPDERVALAAKLVDDAKALLVDDVLDQVLLTPWVARKDAWLRIANAVRPQLGPPQ